MEETGNIIHLRGQICQSLQFGHELFGEQFYVTTLRVPRLSGAEDFLPITISERLLIDEPLTAGRSRWSRRAACCAWKDSCAATTRLSRVPAGF